MRAYDNAIIFVLGPQMDVGSKQITCGQCHKTFPERQLSSSTQLSSSSQTIESCPFCGSQVRATCEIRTLDNDAIILEDIAAIDAWVDVYSKSAKVSCSSTELKHGDMLYRISIPSKWECQIAYDRDRTNFVAIRLATEEYGMKVYAESHTLQLICAKHGVQGFRKHRTDLLHGVDSCEWGACVYLSTDKLCYEIFEPILKRLTKVLDVAVAHFSVA
jgi:hypothetical protein